MEQTEDQDGDLRIRLESEQSLKPPNVVEGFVHDGEADNGIDEIRICVNMAEYPEQQRRAVPDREQTDVKNDILQLIQKEDHTHQEQQMVVAGNHMLRS